MPLHLVVLDTSSIMADVFRYARRREETYLLKHLKSEYVRVFITGQVAEEVPEKILAKSARAGLDSTETLELWSAEYLSRLLVVPVDLAYMPTSDAVSNMMQIDPEDAPTVCLRDLLGPVAVFSDDNHFIAAEIAVADWRQASAAIPGMVASEAMPYLASFVVCTTGFSLYGLGKGAAWAMNNKWGRIAIGGLGVAGLLSRNLWWDDARRRAPELTKRSWDTTRAIISWFGDEMSAGYEARTAWESRVRGTEGVLAVHKIARLLAGSQDPLTRGELARALEPSASASQAKEIRKRLLPIMVGCSAFIEVRHNYWQLGYSGE